MKKILILATIVSLSACTGTRNDGYNVKEVWEKDGIIYARADAIARTEALCYNKARMYARDKVSNYLVNGYSGEDVMKINNEVETFQSNRLSKTESLMNHTNYMLKSYNPETKSCGVELQIPSKEARSMLKVDQDI